MRQYEFVLVVRPTLEDEAVTAIVSQFETTIQRGGGEIVTRGQLIDRIWGSDYVGDTKTLDVHSRHLREKIVAYAKEHDLMVIHDFAYADLVFDVRFLPNPYFVEHLKNYDGNNPDIKKYVMNNKESKQFLERTVDLLNFLMPLYEREGKVRLNIAMGCTGGKHRSVVMADKINSIYSSKKYSVNLNHRDINKS